MEKNHKDNLIDGIQQSVEEENLNVQGSDLPPNSSTDFCVSSGVEINLECGGDSGWVKLHRKLLFNPIARKPEYMSLWIHLLLLANHKNGYRFIFNNRENILNAGQILTGRKKLSKLTGIKETQIENILNYLEKSHQIGQQKTTKNRVITILNWKSYQESDNKVTTKRQQSDTYKNIKNIKNNTDTLNYLKDIPKEDIEQFRHQFKCDISNIKTKANSLYDYCKAKGRVYKNYKAFLSNALRKDFGERTQPLVIRDEKVIIEEDRTPEEQERINKSLEKVRQVLKQ